MVVCHEAVNIVARLGVFPKFLQQCCHQFLYKKSLLHDKLSNLSPIVHTLDVHYRHKIVCKVTSKPLHSVARIDRLKGVFNKRVVDRSTGQSYLYGYSEPVS